MASSIMEILVLKKVQDRLAAYLNFEDLKALRSASKELNAIVLNETNFKDRALFVVSPKVCVQPSNLPLYSHFRLELESVVGDSRCMSWVKDFLPKLKSMQVIMEGGVSNDLLSRLSTILQQCQQLETLQLNARCTGFISNCSKSEEIRTVLQTLKTLEVTDFGSEAAQHVQDLLEQTKNLRSVKIHGSGGETSMTNNNAAAVNVIKALKASRSFLECIEIDDHEIWSIFKVPMEESLEFPNLKNVKIVVRRVEDGSTSENLLKFLERHSGLESLDLCITSRVPAKLFPVLTSKLKGLKKLRIVTKGLEQVDINGWGFLDGFMRLEDFSFSLQKTDRYDDNFGDFVKLFKHLPRTLKAVSLRGIGEYSGEEFLLEGLEVARLNPQIVTHLDMGSSGLLVDDETLQLIIQQFRWLEYLDISNSFCTDDGFTGCGMGDCGDDSDVSLKNLQGLRTLKMTYCKDVTDAVTDALQFRDLVHIDLAKILITKSGLVRVLEQNPSLTEVRTELTLTAAESEKFPRLKKVWTGPKLKLNRYTMHPSIDKTELSESEHESDDDEGMLDD